MEATKDLVCAYKPNLAFYVAYGDEGVAALNRTIMDIRILAPDVPVILDAKFADIGNTNAGYAKFAFEYLGADAVTGESLPRRRSAATVPGSERQGNLRPLPYE